jgi:TPR repeat protein
LAYRDGKGLDANSEEAARWFQAAAEKGHLRAQLKLAEMYEKGLGVEPDGREAARWYELAANQGEPIAQLALGDIYSRGRGLPPDRIRAYVWYSAALASEDNLVRAQAMVARTRLFNEMDEGEMLEAERQAEEFREIQRTLANQGR